MCCPLTTETPPRTIPEVPVGVVVADQHPRVLSLSTSSGDGCQRGGGWGRRCGQRRLGLVLDFVGVLVFGDRLVSRRGQFDAVNRELGLGLAGLRIVECGRRRQLDR